MHRLAVSRAPAALWLSLLLLVLVAATGGGALGADCNENGRPDAEDIAPLHIGFGEPLELDAVPRGDTTWDTAFADFNGDGRLDILLTGESALYLLLSRAGGLFEPLRLIARISPRGTSHALAADIDQDGRPDVTLWEPFASAVVLLRNLGDGEFTKPEVLFGLPGFGGGLMPLTIGQLDDDPAPDLVLRGEQQGHVLLLLNPGRPLFQSREQFIAPVYNSPVVSDLDGDGHADIAAANGAERALTFLKNLGDGSFAPPRAVALEPYSVPLFAADFDGDGKPELTDGRRVYPNRGDAVFAEGERILPSYPTVRLRAGDVDGDGHLDFFGSSSLSPRGLLVVLNSGDGRFQPPLEYRKPPHLGAAGVGDFDDDGLTDIFGTSGSCHRGFVLPRLPGRFPQSPDVDGDGIPDECQKDCNGNGIPDAHEVATGQAADCNRNGVPDACETAGILAFQEGWSDEQFPPCTRFLVDLNGDSHLDIACHLLERLDPPIVDRRGNATYVINYRGRILFYFNDGNGGFDEQGEPIDSGYPRGFASGDIDADGDLDLVTTNLLDWSVRLFLNAGNGSFSAGAPLLLGQRPSWIQAADLDGDGAVDLLVSVGVPQTITIALPGRGDGTFRGLEELIANVSGGWLVDLTGDGRLDIVHGGQSITAHLNEGGFRFSRPRWLATGRIMTIADLDRDGREDIIAAAPTCSERFVLRNSGGTRFQRVDAFGGRVSSNGLAAADFDGDGYLDLLGTGTGGFSVLRNDRTGRFSPPRFFRITPRDAPSAPTFFPPPADVNGDGLADLLVSRFSGSGLTVLLNALERSPDRDQNGIPDECEAGTGQVRGDANQDGAFNLSDPVWLLAHLFLGAGTRLPCSGGDAGDPGPADLELLDASDDGRLDLSDAVAMLRFLFQGEPSPLALGGGCEAVGGCPGACRMP